MYDGDLVVFAFGSIDFCFLIDIFFCSYFIYDVTFPHKSVIATLWQSFVCLEISIKMLPQKWNDVTDDISDFGTHRACELSIWQLNKILVLV